MILQSHLIYLWLRIIQKALMLTPPPPLQHRHTWNGYLLTGRCCSRGRVPFVSGASFFRGTYLVTDLKPLAPPTECTVVEVSSALSRRSKKFAKKNQQKTMLINRNLKCQPYIVDVRSIAVFTANFVTVRGVLAPLFRIEC